jgi:hypothetical protein
LLVPGIGSITGERASSHAIESCAGDTPSRLATSSTVAEPDVASVPVASGKYGRNAMPFSSQRASTASGLAADGAGPADPVEHVLNGDDRRLRERGVELLDGDVAEREVTNLADLLEIDHHVERVRERDLRLVEPAQVSDRKLLEPERLQICIDGVAQLLGRHRGYPALVVEALGAVFRRDDDVVRIRMQCLDDQTIRDERPVIPGGVDEVDAELDRTTKHGVRSRRIVGLAPYALAGEAHRAVAETTH